MKNILVPTDFSATADNALRYAFELAARGGAHITLLHVIYPNQGLENDVYQVFWDTYERERLDALEALTARFKSEEPFQSVEVKVATEVGFPTPTIGYYATEHHFDMIVMGTTGAGGLKSALLGSNTAGLAAHCKTPVLAVPDGCAFRPDANFAFATDLKIEVSDRSMILLQKFLALHYSGLHVVSVTDKDKASFEAAEKIVSEALEGIDHDFHYLHSDSVAEAIENFIEARDMNGLVVVSHRHSLWDRLFYRSVSKQLVEHLHLPMLVLHDKGKK